MTTHPIRGESEVIKLINIFLDGLVSVGNDAGFEGDSLLSKVIEFGGAPPKGSGMDQSNTTMVNAMDRYRAKHVDFHKIEQIVWRLISKTETRRHILALLVRHYYHGINDRTGKCYNDEDRLGLWMEHLNRFPWNDSEIIKLTKDEAESKFRYGYHRAGPRLVRREAGI